MIRFLPSFLLLLFLIIVETSFVGALPAPWRFAPVVFASAVYTIQHLASKSGVWWLFGYGIFLDIWHLGVMRGESVILLVVGLAAFLLSRRVFTNRSLYGVIGSAFVSFTLWRLLTALVFFFTNAKHPDAVPWLTFLSFSVWQGILLLFLVSLFFFLAGRMRRALRSVWLFPKSHETF